MHIVLMPCVSSSQVILLSSVSFYKCHADKSCTFASFNTFKWFFHLAHYWLLLLLCPETHPRKVVRVLVTWQPLLICRLPFTIRLWHFTGPRYTVLATQFNCTKIFRKTFKNLNFNVFFYKMFMKDIRSGSSSQMSQQLHYVSDCQCTVVLRISEQSDEVPTIVLVPFFPLQASSSLQLFVNFPGGWYAQQVVASSNV